MLPDMDLSARTFWVTKAGNSEDEYEDAYCPEHLRDRKGHIARFAVADGASEGMLSGPWAKILTRSFCRAYQRPSRSAMRVLISRSCDSWETWKAAYLERRAGAGKPAQWWEEQGLRTGPFATLLGVAFLMPGGSETGRWDAVALGDSCLFMVRGGEVLERFPIEQSSGFGQRPVLISADPVRNAAYLDRIGQRSGALARGDRFYLATDALSAWFLRESEGGWAPWESLDELDNQESFACMVKELRADGSMRNDDVTLTCIRVV